MMGKKRLLLAAISLCAVAALAACSPQQAPTGGESDDGGAPAVEAVAWSADSDCASCHAEESAAAADAATGSGFHAGQGVTCATCHADEAMGEVHADYATARPPSPAASSRWARWASSRSRRAKSFRPRLPRPPP